MTVTMKTPVTSRRTVLGALGGGLLAPLLSTGSRARAAAPPRRLILLYTQEGLIPKLVVPESAPGPLAALPPALAPLEPFRRRLNIVSGLAMHSCIDQPWEGEPFVSAHTGSVHLFTGAPCLGPARHPRLGHPEPSAAGGPSVDQIVAGRLAGEAAHRSLVFGFARGDIGAGPGGRISFAERGHPGFDADESPQKAFARLADPAAVAGVPAERLAREQRSILDYARGRIQRAQARLGQQDRHKLEQHLSALRELEARLARPAAATRCEGAAWAPIAAAAAPEPVPHTVTGFVELIKLALSCDLTRVVSLQMGGSGGYGMNMRHVLLDGRPIDHNEHEVSHAGSIDRRPEKQLACTRWKAGVVAELLAALDSVEEAGGTLLDHSLVVWASQMSTPWDHAMAPLPVILAGGCGGRVRTGRFLSYGEPRLLRPRPGDARRVDSSAYAPHNRLLVSICHAMGLEDVTTVGAARYCAGGGLEGLLA